ncbi:MAG: HK97 gp10 family phage protein [Bacteroidales bacterium]|nr:HK97 gp10 family phage protein [Bacteroidales bacterium]
MSTRVDVDLTEVRNFVEKLQTVARGDFKKELQEWLEALGTDFLRIVQDEIIRRQVVSHRELLASFEQGAAGNVWKVSDGGLTLEVGSSVEYAGYVEDGHDQQPGRFIPGYWEGNRFVYEPGYPGGMVLKADRVDGRHYFASAVRILEAMFPGYLDAKMSEWISKYLSF